MESTGILRHHEHIPRMKRRNCSENGSQTNRVKERLQNIAKRTYRKI